jgi:Flp pilus assembly protein TadD
MVEGAIMSIINKMHQGLKENADSSPMLASMPVQKQKKKVLLFALISLLLASSIGLSYLIYDKENELSADIKIDPVEEVITVEQPVVVKPLATSKAGATPVDKVALTKVVTVNEQAPKVEQVNDSTAVKALAPINVSDKPSSPVTAKKVLTSTPVAKDPVVTKKATKITPVPKKSEAAVKKTAHLEIKKSVLSPSELANIHLKSAEKALLKGDTQLAAQEKIKALNVKPDLHSVRESLALYYYGIGEQEQGKRLLKKGAVTFPEYSDFNLILSRIALKEGDQQKAYLYLQQSPPEVEGHIDYHVSYAILAQKFKDYERSEKLYQGLLTQRPNNGRWRMSLAIAQDKLSKEKLAVENYKKALLQIDLSSNAKKYINQRLTYLANQ